MVVLSSCLLKRQPASIHRAQAPCPCSDFPQGSYGWIGFVRGSFLGCLALPIPVVSSHLMVLWSFHVCSATVDFCISPLWHNFGSLLHWQRVLDLGQHGAKRPSRPEDHLQVVLPTDLTDVLRDSCSVKQQSGRIPSSSGDSLRSLTCWWSG